jgi:Fe-S cluster biogenesis protein NfuA
MGVLRRKEDQRAVIEARIRDAIAGIIPLLRLAPADLELVAFHTATGVAELRIEGGCPDCEMTAATFLQGIEAHLRARVPEVRAVRTLSSDHSGHA